MNCPKCHAVLPNDSEFCQYCGTNIKTALEEIERKNFEEARSIVGGNAEAFLKRGFMALEDEQWQKADVFFEGVLNQDAENAQAHLGKLMAELHAKTQGDLKNCDTPFDGSSNYRKVIRFADPALAETLNGYITSINERNENARLTDIYNRAKSAMDEAKLKAIFKENAYIVAADLFATIPGYEDADVLAEQCREKAAECRKNKIYNKACANMDGTLSGYESAIKLFQTIFGWKDVDERICKCQKKIEEINAKEEADRLEAARKAEERRIAAEKTAKKRKKAFAIGTPIVATCIVFVIVLTTVIIPKQKFNKAMSLMDSGDYDSAYALLEEIGNSEAIASSKYDRAMKFIDTGDYEPAYMLLNGLSYKDSEDKLICIKQIILGKANVGDIVYFGAYEQDNNTSNGKEAIEWIVLAKENGKAFIISKYALDCQKYNSTYADITWKKCSLRTWMNGMFLNNAFSTEERAKIETTKVSADKNPIYSTNPGNTANDKVFLISITEAERYFTNDESRKCAPTVYAKAQGAWTDDIKTASGEATCWWWLRSPGYGQNYAAGVIPDGSVFYAGDDVNDDRVAVRPAMWIDLGS